ncbi:MFS transporter [Azorhizobium oxalatiphilum]|uniref:MFS transporter n=1 Tax=Azorhizobium oxalatiphilum TaxID=980631 RepID=A0A917C6B0_9HYPH|nr:OFA family MFS transporter [Azorhizobium oxalatiphilum]GGF71150.1 MFS transporter [Azorhizobium oxalatiphilum]
MSIAAYQPSAAPFLSRERTIAGAHFNRWLVPPAALAIHLCIGMAYGFSVFWLPLSRAVGINQSIACPADMGFLARVVATTCDWQISMLGWTYTLFFVLLGCSAALFGGWLEHAGPRKAGLVSAFCWCGGLVISATGIHLHQIWMLWLGSGVLGGIGLGLGYISPVSTLIKWFPDRRGMATGMAIMGFGGGAMIGAPLADILMRTFATPTSVGVWQTFLVLAAIYFVFMVCGALGYRVPAEGWKPAGWSGVSISTRKLVSKHDVSLEAAWRTPQFWLLWAALCLNVSAGIGVLGMASPMLQEVFGGRLIGLNLPFNELSTAQKAQIAAIAAGFTGLLSLCNIGGRLAWATFSDRIGRKATFFTFFILGLALYALVPWSATLGGTVLFVLILCVVVSMYGGGFATIPAYLADLFGTRMVGAIHGRILTAWSAAGILGPVLINYLREYQIASGIPLSQAYNQTMYILAGLLALGVVCNLLVKPVAARHYMKHKPAPTPAAAPAPRAATLGDTPVSAPAVTADGFGLLALLAWAAVGLPLAWSMWITFQKALILLH